jgi:hypothetical protein
VVAATAARAVAERQVGLGLRALTEKECSCGGSGGSS